jgi:hypothetical protein
MLAHSDATRNMDVRGFIGNIGPLIVGCNDTTRNSMSACRYAKILSNSSWCVRVAS